MNDNSKPRRLEEDTINYLTDIELQFTDDLDKDSKEILINNVLSEIKQRTASVACDRKTNYLLEKICIEASLESLLEIVNRLSPYVIFLVRNRYSSHIIQTIVSRLCYTFKFEMDDLPDTIDENIIVNTMKPLIEVLITQSHWLIKDQCASHVMRSLCSLLCGLPVLSERKGKKSKHQHAVSLSEPLQNLIVPKQFYINEAASFNVPSDFKDFLFKLINDNILQISTKDIELLIADFSSSAVLGFLVRILSNPKLVSDSQGNCIGRKLAHRLFCLALGWPEDDTYHDYSNNHVDVSSKTASAIVSDLATRVPSNVREIFYAMAGDRAGSYFLESMIECGSIWLVCNVLAASVVSRMEEFVNDGSGNFIIQAALRRLACELERLYVGEVVVIEPTLILSLSDVMLSELTSDNKFFEVMLGTKGGVVIWMLELSRWYEMSSKKSPKYINNIEGKDWNWVIGSLVISSWIAKCNSEASTENNNEANGKAALLSSALNTFLHESPKSNKNKGSDNADGVNTESSQVSEQLLVARLVALLFQSPNSKISALAASAFSRISSDALIFVSTSGSVSRAVLDVFFDTFHSDNAAASAVNTSGSKDSCAKEVKILISNLASIGGKHLAGHFVGQHIVKRAFNAADIRGKEKWAMMLSADRDALLRTKEGRASLHLVNYELYSRDIAEWRSAAKRRAKAEAILQELDNTAPPHNGKGESASGNVVTESGEGGGKRKRKRHNKNSKEESTVALPPNEEHDANKPPVEASEDRNDKQGRKRKRKRSKNSNNNTDSIEL